jgi:hypothetical protein
LILLLLEVLALRWVDARGMAVSARLSSLGLLAAIAAASLAAAGERVKPRPPR